MHFLNIFFYSLANLLQLANLWQPMLLPDTFLDFKSNKEDQHLSTSLFSIIFSISKIQYSSFNKYLIFIMTIPIPSTKEFQLFKPHPIPIHLDFSRLCLGFASATPWIRSSATIVARRVITLIMRLGT